ncbi:probable ATP-dependent RNA helicase kurz [Prorops nasuta]|uniref:probable ATP-dependent RNA helicase kurz n=1 Tax=Prorops nasuta TaxID=863751 RepID=UPI0034CE8C74
MGKKGYNWKARNVSEIKIDDSATKKIVLDINHRSDSYDTCNALVLPSTKRKTKKNDKEKSVSRLLSKKRRKELEKVVERKQKKLQRASLLDELAKVQAPIDELKQYTSLTTIQTKGLKRHLRELETLVIKNSADTNDENEDKEEFVTNAIKGAKKKRISALVSEEGKNTSSDPNVIPLNISSESESESNEDEDSECVKEDSQTHNKINTIQEDNTSVIKSLDSKCSLKKDESVLLKAEVLVKKTNNNNTVSNKEVKIKGWFVESLDTEVNKNVATQNIPASFVMVNRKPDIQAARMKLPVVAEEQTIVEAINENPVVIITGETGSGKTTQVPQFLYEAGYAKSRMIGVTEPRRVAAMSMSRRVAEEMNLSENEVSYLIRFEGNTTPETKIKFMTDGVLLKEVQSDFLLTKYSVIILDEAHERSVYTDILIGLLSRIVPLRYKRNDPLKLVIMSATLRIEEFVENTRLFKIKPPVITVDSRQFPVTIHFNRKTSADYVTDALRKAVKIHTRLPEGGILIFLTGQREVNSVVRKLRKAFPWKRYDSAKVNSIKSEEEKSFERKKEDDKGSDNNDDNEKKSDTENKEESDDDFNANEALRRNKQRRKKQLSDLPNINLDDFSVVPIDDTHEDTIYQDENDDELIDDDEDADEDVFDLTGLSNVQPLWVLPLYSLLPKHKQAKVFEAVPEGYRLCVVATNVAETSLTIPNIKYVVDSGRCKMRLYDKVTGVTTYRINFTSKAGADQRAGRAGRTGPGHCYRLYSSAVFNDQFEPYTQSEIKRKPVDDLVLQMKVMNIDKVVNFPFPSPPDIDQLKFAENRLTILGALKEQPLHTHNKYNAKVTQLGHSIAAFPVAPRYGKMLALSHQHNLLNYTICMVAALSVQEVLIEAFDVEGSTKNKWSQTRRLWAGTANSLLLGDPMVLIRAIGAAEYAGSKGKLLPFCEEHGLRHKAVIEIRKLRQQLTNEINLNIPNLNLTVDPKMAPPTDSQAKLLRQIILSGMADQIARKVPPDEVKEDQDKIKWKYAYKTLEMEDPVFMHSSCVLRKTLPEWVVYQEVYETNKIYMRGVTAIEPEWLPKFAPTLCNLSEPLMDPPPWYDSNTDKVMCRITGSIGKAGWELPLINSEYPLSVEGVKWFARFFLEGDVCRKLKRYTRSLLSTPGSINKTWSKLIPRTEAITKALLSQEVMSKDKLLAIWSSDNTFLLSAYLKWLPESAHAEVTLLWPPT